MKYIFDVEIATQYGVEEAIMIENLRFWILKNKANNQHYYDGRYWSYNSVTAFRKLYPFWTEKQIRRILDSLVEKGIIIKGNYNKTPYDRTTWFAFKDEDKYIPSYLNEQEEKGNSICPNGQMEITKRANQNDHLGEPIPYIKPYNKKTDTFILSTNLKNSSHSQTGLVTSKEINTPEKRQYLDHVFLTENQYNELVSKFGLEVTEDYIERLNNYIHQIGKKKAEAKYKSHYHVILNWSNRDRKEIERRVHVAEAIRKRDGILRPGESIFDD